MFLAKLLVYTVSFTFAIYLTHHASPMNDFSKNVNLETNLQNKLHRHLNSYVDRKMLKSKELTFKLLNKIWNRYELAGISGSQFFLGANNMGSFTWDIIKYKFVKKVLTKEPFLMVFGGTSVTAGHDNYFNQSFPVIVKKRLAPIMDALEIPFTVRNIAMGANDCIPYTFCYESMGGFDPDFIGWEQSYSCGRDDAMFEFAARWAGWSKHRGLIYFSASGGFVPNCPPSSEHPFYSDEEWEPVNSSTNSWRPSQSDLEAQKAALNQYWQAKPSVSRFVTVLSDYKGIGYHGFNIWDNHPLVACPGKDKQMASNQKALSCIDACQIRFFSGEAARYGTGKAGMKHHPTAAWHLLRGEAIVWLYALTLLDALYLVETERATGKPDSDIASEYTAKLKSLQPDMPTASTCQFWGCQNKPICYTNFQPHYNDNLTLRSLLVGTTNWTYHQEDYGERTQMFGYLDSKTVYRAEKGRASGEIHFKIDITGADYIYICGYAFRDSLKFAEFHFEFNVEDSRRREGLYEPNGEARVAWHRTKYLSHECKRLFGLPPGYHVLSIRTSLNKTDHRTGVTHIITWP